MHRRAARQASRARVLPHLPSLVYERPVQPRAVTGGVADDRPLHLATIGKERTGFMVGPDRLVWHAARGWREARGRRRWTGLPCASLDGTAGAVTARPDEEWRGRLHGVVSKALDDEQIL
jgi:hypothetical protein